MVLKYRCTGTWSSKCSRGSSSGRATTSGFWLQSTYSSNLSWHWRCCATSAVSAIDCERVNSIVVFVHDPPQKSSKARAACSVNTLSSTSLWRSWRAKCWTVFLDGPVFSGWRRATCRFPITPIQTSEGARTRIGMRSISSDTSGEILCGQLFRRFCSLIDYLQPPK